MWLSELKTVDIGSDAKRAFVVSLGSTEQHGPYAPLGTDTYIQNAFLRAAEKKLPKVVFLPTIPITCSSEHIGFVGTVSLEPPTLHGILRDITKSLAQGATDLMFVSWHGGNKSVIDDFIAKEKLNFKTTKLSQVTFGDESTDRAAEELLDGPLDDHAGNMEISLMLAIRPGLVRKPGATDSKVAVNHEWGKRPVIDSAPDGVVDSHPRWVASEAIGNELLDLYSDNLVEKLQKVIADA